MIKWLKWVFRRGVRGSMLLNMDPGDYVVAMTPFRDLIVIASRYGEVYTICLNGPPHNSPNIDLVPEAIIQKVYP